MTKRLRVYLVGLAVLLPGCGHRGDPRPPLRKTPPAPGEFRVAQRGDAIELSARTPAASVDNVPYAGLTLEFLYTTGQGDMEKTGARLTVKAEPGGRGTVTLPLPRPGTILRAAVRALAGGNKGAKAATTTLVARAVVEAPHDLTASLGDEGVTLGWLGPKPEPLPSPSPTPPPAGLATGGRSPGGTPQADATHGKPSGALAAPAGTAAPAPAAETGAAAPAAPKPRANGFLVYRRVGSARYEDPLESEPLERRRFLDASVPLGASACYVVRAAAATSPLVESAPSNEVCLETRDITPPAAPAGLVILPRPEGLELLWSPSREEDLAGYRVYRALAGEAPARLAELPAAEASYLDATAEKGRRYAYSLTAFDRTGNESEPCTPVEARRP
jgi:hypothetical protein